MAAYIPVRIVCDRCGVLIGIVEQKMGHYHRPDASEFPEGTIVGPDGEGEYCERCATKYAKQLGFNTEED